jgi:hypothetical protein
MGVGGGVQRIEMTERGTPVAGGAELGTVGTYERLHGTVFGPTAPGSTAESISSLEGAGFELGPSREEDAFRRNGKCGAAKKQATSVSMLPGTEGSNLALSSEESRANLTSSTEDENNDQTQDPAQPALCGVFSCGSSDVALRRNEPLFAR